MTNDFPADRFNDANAAHAFRALASSTDFDLVRWKLLARYAAVKHGLFPLTDGGLLNRAAGKLEELEWVLEQFGEPLYGGLPLADGTSADETAPGRIAPAPEIGGGSPGGSGSRPPL